MITPAELRRQIEALTLGLLNLGIAIQHNTPLLLETGHGSGRVTWSRTTSLSSTFGRFATLDEYRYFLRENDYNVILLDGALLQISYVLRHNAVVAHRLCYYPCPIEISDEERAEFTIEELLDLHAESLADRIRLRSPVRFDYAPDAARLGHPATHMTVSEESCRIAVSAPLSVGHFIRFVFRNFYPLFWNQHDLIRDAALHQHVTTLDELEDDELYVGWRRS